MPDQRTTIFEGGVVIVQKGAHTKSCRIIPGRYYQFGKHDEGQCSINLEDSLGHPFGSTFKMVRIDKKKFKLEKTDGPLMSMDIAIDSGSDNRDLLDDGQSQKLSKENINELKDQGLTGQQVIQTLAENSSTFKDKTKFSQEKYVNKKKKKYDEYLTIVKPTLRLLTNMYYAQEPMRISNLRLDSLAQILSYVNAQPGLKLAVFEAGTQALITAAMLQRMGEAGSLVHVYHKSTPVRDALDLMNFTLAELEVLTFINVENLPRLEGGKFLNSRAGEDGKSDSITSQDQTCDSPKKKIMKLEDKPEKAENNDLIVDKSSSELKGPEQIATVENNDLTVENSPQKMDVDQKIEKVENNYCKDDCKVDKTQKVSKIECSRPKKFIRSQVEETAMSRSVLSGGVEGVVVACRQHPTSIALALLKFLKPGHPFVVFSPYKEPLVELFFDLKKNNLVNLRLTETWLRHYQVLPQRTHPEINMSGNGGYLLFGTKVVY